MRKAREAESRWPSVAGSEAAERGRTSSEGAQHADLPTRAAHPARSPLLAPPRLVPSPPLTTSTLGDQTRARTVAARSRPGSCCNRPLLLETGQAGQAGHPPWASQTLDRSNSGVGAADGDTYDGGGRSCTNINKKTHRVQISHFSKQGRQGTPSGLADPQTAVTRHDSVLIDLFTPISRSLAV